MVGMPLQRCGQGNLLPDMQCTFCETLSLTQTRNLRVPSTLVVYLNGMRLRSALIGFEHAGFLMRDVYHDMFAARE